MFTLKIEQTYSEREEGKPDSVVGQSTAFYGVDSLVIQCPVRDAVDRRGIHQSWAQSGSSYTDMMSTVRVPDQDEPWVQSGILIEAKVNGESAWFLASRAWLLGPDGRTIERLA